MDEMSQLHQMFFQQLRFSVVTICYCEERMEVKTVTEKKEMEGDLKKKFP